MSGKKGMRDKLLNSPVRAEAWRAGVRVGLIRNRLQKHFLGVLELTATQIKAAEILLNRTIPTMQSFEHSGEVLVDHIARIPQTNENAEQWQQQHSPDAKPPQTLQ